ncbi:MAG TPA: hypothetical protein EYP56_15895 [Planctomycetaceae bacterium]|nr:hypothetical protein [Planctomycetaceae bacterium]
MSTVIRASHRGTEINGIAFQLEDVAARAQAYLDKVRQQAAQILDEAHRQADTIRRRAEQEGRRAGLEAVEQMVRQQLGSQLETLLPALRQFVTQLEHAKQAWLTHWERAALDVALAISERLLRREVARTPELPFTLLREALELATGSASLRIHLNPTDYENLKPQLQMLVDQLAPAAETHWVADDEIGPGACRVETQFGMIDQTWQTQLKRIQEELI